MARLFISWAHSAAGRFDKAVDAAPRAAEESGRIRVTRVVLAEAYARAGRTNAAQELLQETLADRTVRYLSLIGSPGCMLGSRT
jgi:predicted Zn-dependent protease